MSMFATMEYHSQRGFHDPLRSFNDTLQRLSMPYSYDQEWGHGMSGALTRLFRDLPRARWSMPDTRVSLEQWDTLSAAYLDRFSPLGLVASFYCHAKAQQVPTSRWMQEWYKESYGKLDTFDPLGFVNSLYGHARLGLKPPPEWLEKWQYVAESRHVQLSDQELSLSLYALAVMHLLGADVKGTAERLADDLRSRFAARDYAISIKDAHQFYLASSVFGWKEDPRLVQAVWNGDFVQGESATEIRVGNMLKNACRDQKRIAGWKILKVEKEALHPLTLSPSDLRLTLASAKHGGIYEAYLEIDGTTHFVQHPSGMMRHNGKTLLRDHLMQRWARHTGGGFGTLPMQKAGEGALWEELGAAISAAMERVPQRVVTSVVRVPEQVDTRRR